MCIERKKGAVTTM